MSTPPPPPPQPPYQPASRPPVGRMGPKQKMTFGMLAVAAVIALTVVGLVTKDKDEPSKPLSPALELVRTGWNGMTATQQHAVCADVRRLGAEVVADQLQTLFKMPARSAHDDIVFFLEDLACKKA